MQKILRIYVGNYGVPLAWYDGQLLDLSDPETLEAVDTIINLENGGGKTTLLSFIFSCFEPRLDMWLKHLADKNKRNHMWQYFSDDGLPGTCLMEWSMPPRTLSGKPYKLVIGQVVSAQADNLMRIFFSFTVNKNYKLESVPAPKLHPEPARNLQDFQRWLHKAGQDNADFYSTRTQDEWVKHLREERLLDIDMLRMQVKFSAAHEGGFDKGFLDFKTEEHFLCKLLDLTLDEQRAVAVRAAVVAACEKLKRKPEFEKKLDALTRLQQAMSAFSTRAQAYVQAREAKDAVQHKGIALALALMGREKERAASAQTLAALAIEQDELARVSREQALAARIEHHTLELLLRTRQAEQRGLAQQGAQARQDTAELELRYRKAAHSRSNVLALTELHKNLSAQFELAQEGLAPFRVTLDTQGALLREALGQQQRQAQRRAQAEEEAKRAARLALEQGKGERAQLEQEDNRLAREHARLESDQRQYEVRRERLLKEGFLRTPEQTAVQAAAEWAQLAREQREEAARLLAREGELKQEANAAREQHAQQNVRITRLEGELDSRRRFLDAGFTAKEELAQDPTLRLVADASLAEPDSQTLAPALEGFLARTDSDLAAIAIRIAELAASRQSIEDTRLAGRNADVDTLVAALAEMGVKSARAFNTYVAEVVPDAAAARATVQSDPAKFLGVAVVPGELNHARKVLAAPPKLLKPVMVSTVSATPAPDSAERFVVAPDTDAAYNFEAALALEATLTQRLEEEERTKSTLQERQSAARSAQTRLENYRVHYGEGKLARAHGEVQRLQAELSEAQAAAVEFERRAAERQSAAEECRAKATTSADEARNAAQREGALRDFHTELEASLEQRKAQLTAAEEQQKELAQRRATLEAHIAACEQHEREAHDRWRDCEQNVRELGEERTQVEHWDKELPAEENLRQHPQPLDALRALYHGAKQTYEMKAENQLGAVKIQLKQAAEQRVKAEGDYEKAFSKVPMNEVQARLGLHFDSAIPQAERELEQSRTASSAAATQLALAKSEQERYARDNKKLIGAPTPQMEDLSETQLPLSSAAARERSEQWDVAAERAQREAAQARAGAQAAENAAREAHQHYESLKSALDLPEGLEGQPCELQADGFAQVKALITEHKEAEREARRSEKAARESFDTVMGDAATPAMLEVEPHMANQLKANTFDAACEDRQRLADGIADRVATTNDYLKAMEADFEGCAQELYTLASDSITILNSALKNDKKIPQGAPYVGGKSILKMRAQFGTIKAEDRRAAVRAYLISCIAANVVPAKGAELAAAVLVKMQPQATLGIQVLRLVRDDAHQYARVENITNSGAEGVAMAMFLYILVLQLRAEVRDKAKRSGGGPLFLDNPFAQTTTVSLWQPQRALARAAGMQLIFATALTDYNSLGEFEHFVRLRHAGKNLRTGRNHLEVVDFQLAEQESH